jgi:DNA-binding transcriptional MerR regulator
MTRSKLLTIKNLINELDMGKATLKFVLHRFSPWLATQVVNDETCYTEQAVTTLLKIKKFLDAGMLPEQVEASLAQEAELLKASASVQHPAGNQGTIPVDIASVSMFKDMFQAYIEKQDRIALAQEALARVEEKKAGAMEKRAAAEEKKADAMTNIALALQEMNQRHNAAPQAMEIAGRAVETMALEESPDMDDLSLLVNETALTPEDIDDLSSLIDSVSDPDSDLEDRPEETRSAPETNDQPNDMDDLSKLLDSDLSSSNSPDNRNDNKDDNEDDLDDLFSFVDMDTDAPKDLNGDPDDLSLLVDGTGEESGQVPPGADTQTDDLWSLVSDTQGSNQEIQSPAEPSADGLAPEMDNLSALINEAPENSQATADTTSEENEDSVDAPTDSLTETPSIKPDISPDQDMKKYKAAIMEIIIELKEQGLTARQTTDRFNHDGVATLSGKPTWGLKAIEKIYRFIDSAK